VRAIPKLSQLVGVACVLSLVANCSPVPALNLAELIGRADLIVTGSLVSVKQLGLIKAEVAGRSRQVHLMTGTVRIAEVLKGNPRGQDVTLRWIVPEESDGYASIPEGIYRLIFLRSGTESSYEVASVHYPTLVAVPETQSEGTTVTDRVINQLAAVVRSTTTRPEDRVEAINALSTIESATVVSILKRALREQDASVQLAAAAILLERNDISALPLVEAKLVSPVANLPPYLRHNLLFGISEGVKDEKAIPMLSQLMQLSDVEARRSAASALRHTQSREAIVPLLSALSDRDFEVRYYAAIGLAETTGQSDWRPLMEDFKANEQKYLIHWKNLANPR